MKLGLQWLIGLTLASLVAGLFLWDGEPESTQKKNEQLPSPAPQLASQLIETSASSEVSMTRKFDLFSKFPIDRNQGVSARYKFAKDCAKFRRFESFYLQQSANPSWPLNNSEAMASAEPDVREELKVMTAFLDSNRQACSEWLENIPRDLANAQIYEASLQAALSGDEDAAACFILASWQVPDEYSDYYSQLAEKYANNTKDFVNNALSSGNWKVVLAAYSAAQEQHGLQTNLALSRQNIYLLSRLVQLGSLDALQESEVGYVAATVATHLTASDLVSLDSQASNLYVNNFNRGNASLQSVTDMCVN